MAKIDYISILNEIRAFEKSLSEKYCCHIELALVSTGKSSLTDLVDTVSRVYHGKISPLPAEGIRDRSRNKKLVMMRNIYFYIAREVSGKSLENIGREIDFDHSTVIYGCRMVDCKINENDFSYMKYLRIVRVAMEEKGLKHTNL